jgi:hypothetical protein
VPRIVATLSLAALLVAVLPGDVGQARLRGTLTKTVDRVTTTVEKTADTTVGGTLRTVDGAVGGTVTTLTRVVETAATSLTGWLYTDAETTLDHVADVTGASALWRLGYDGVIVTDSIEAQAVLDRSGVGRAAERSLRAGADLVLTTGSASWNLIHPWLLREAQASPDFRRRVRESAARVLALKGEVALLD